MTFREQNSSIQLHLFSRLLTRSLLAATASTAIVFSSEPATAEPMTLEVALASAYLSNPQLEAQRAALRATDEEVAKALAGWRPSIAGQGSYGWQRQRQTLLGPQTTNSIPQAQQLTVSQPLYNGQTIPNTEHAKDLVDSGRAQLQATEQTVLYNAAAAYFAVLRDMQIVEAYHADVANLRSILKSADDRLRLGDLTRTDVSQASARLLGSQLSLQTAEQQLNTSRAAFEHLVGRPAETLIDHDLPKLPSDREQALSISLAHNPTLEQSKANARAADHAVDAAIGGLLPSASIQASYGRSLNEIAPGVSQNGISVLGQLTIPLYQGGVGEAQVREAKEQLSQAEMAAQDAERQVHEDLSNAWQNLQNTRASAELALRQASDNDTAYHGSIIESQVGGRTMIDILNADQELLQAKLSAVTYRESNVTAAYQVLNVMGQMTAKDLKLPVTLYDPRDHYDADATSWFGLGD